MSKFFDKYPEYKNSLQKTVLAYVKSPLNPKMDGVAQYRSGISILNILNYLDGDLPTKAFINLINKYDIPIDEDRYFPDHSERFDNAVSGFVTEIVAILIKEFYLHLEQ